MVCVVVCGISIGVNAAQHECAFSYMGNETIGPSIVGSHTVNVYNSDTEQMETRVCYISSRTEYQVWKCACGARENRNSITCTYHSICVL